MKYLAIAGAVVGAINSSWASEASHALIVQEVFNTPEIAERIGRYVAGEDLGGMNHWSAFNRTSKNICSTLSRQKSKYANLIDESHTNTLMQLHRTLMNVNAIGSTYAKGLLPQIKDAFHITTIPEFFLEYVEGFLNQISSVLCSRHPELYYRKGYRKNTSKYDMFYNNLYYIPTSSEKKENFILTADLIKKTQEIQKNFEEWKKDKETNNLFIILKSEAIKWFYEWYINAWDYIVDDISDWHKASYRYKKNAKDLNMDKQFCENIEELIVVGKKIKENLKKSKDIFIGIWKGIAGSHKITKLREGDFSPENSENTGQKIYNKITEEFEKAGFNNFLKQKADFELSHEKICRILKERKIELLIRTNKILSAKNLMIKLDEKLEKLSQESLIEPHDLEQFRIQMQPVFQEISSSNIENLNFQSQEGWGPVLNFLNHRENTLLEEMKKIFQRWLLYQFPHNPLLKECFYNTLENNNLEASLEDYAPPRKKRRYHLNKIW